MKHYPSISGSGGQDFVEMHAHVFDKLDGSNLRFEWNDKRGWYKQGTRQRLFDKSDDQFGPAIRVFQNVLAEPLARILKDHRYKQAIVFAEYWGPNSFAGRHVDTDVKTLTLFDVAPYKEGLLGPVQFIRMFADLVPTPRYLGMHHWTRGFVQQVRDGHVEGITLEGVVGKQGERHKLLMAKAKTQAWIDKVMLLYGPEEGRKLVDS